MKISFAICTHNEGDYIRNLLSRLTEFIRLDAPSGIEYEIVVIDDFSEDPETLNILREFAPHIHVFEHSLAGDFAAHKNFMNECCTGDWILNLDADEWVTEDFLGYMSMIIEANPDIEAYWLPRVNTVDGLTLKHIQKWGWVLTKMEERRKIKVIDADSEEYKLLKDFGHIISEENGVVTYYEPIVAWPDYQMRLYKNDAKIVWVGKVHERLQGFGKFGMMPQETILAIQHFKDIDRQERQNNFYETL
jgi:glycosyltransferase involved in cell wall biosynthesis